MIRESYRIRIYVKFLGECSKAAFSVARNAITANFADLVGGQQRIVTFVTAYTQTRIVSMLTIFRVCDPFKVVRAVVSFYAVNVINKRFAIWIRDKCLRDETMNFKTFLCITFF